MTLVPTYLKCSRYFFNSWHDSSMKEHQSIRLTYILYVNSANVTSWMFPVTCFQFVSKPAPLTRACLEPTRYTGIRYPSLLPPTCLKISPLLLLPLFLFFKVLYILLLYEWRHISKQFSSFFFIHIYCTYFKCWTANFCVHILQDLLWFTEWGWMILPTLRSIGNYSCYGGKKKKKACIED